MTAPDPDYKPSRVILARRALARRRAAVQRRRTVGGALAVAALVALVVATAPGGGHHAARPGGGLRALAEGPRPLHPPGQLDASRIDRAINRVLTYAPFVSRGSARHREIALTFDDGPGPYTTRIVHELRRLRAPATFFEVGQMIPVFRAAGRYVHRFFPIGDHTESHLQMARLPRSAQRAEVLDDADRLRIERVPFPRMFRPPYASFDQETFAVLKRLRMLMVLWSIDSEDYLRPGAKAIVHNVVSRAQPGAIVLMHDAGGDRSQTLAALPAIVHKLRRRGYRLVTVPQMMLDAPPPRHQPQLPPPNAGRG